ncbi:hypothetical protein HPP92_009440 [Vanilla planifolia]|uniref:Uncharacterized protein n=1 Tax=Vanilla planifolia TaxID=51239 RepID=A0A835V871_VANPL|nr:hypothetical protein HPP92_009440 [Vanilla planifolia]
MVHQILEDRQKNSPEKIDRIGPLHRQPTPAFRQINETERRKPTKQRVREELGKQEEEVRRWRRNEVSEKLGSRTMEPRDH